MEASLKFIFLLSFTLILAFSILAESASDYGFTAELVHRDSPRSPYYNPADTPHQRMANAVRRSISRVNRLDPSSAGAPKTPSTTLVPNDGVYLMNISLGNPRVTILGIADTGSDLIWTQCKPCADCFKQAAPLFDPRKSSTYKDIPCHTSLCGVLDQTACYGRPGLCTYAYSYGEKSYTAGTLATETFTIGSTSGRPVSFPKVIFGCGHRNNGNFDPHQSGIIGLGGGSASLISQMGNATGGKFSHCLVPHSSNHQASSKLNFGANAVVAGPGVTFYYLTLEAVSVGETRIEYTSGNTSTSVEEGNIVIDSGTTLTLLPQEFYTKIEAAVVKSVKLPRVRDPSHVFNLCYKAEKDTGIGAPTVTFHFKGADVRLNPANSFFRIADDIICFTVQATPVQLNIYGNLAQSNYLIGYDIQNMKLSFKPVDCTSY
ncbi:hypothetical protein ACJRO7_020506 [Eucalyptus globulus]|uniref:Peptidase A1 domain-containing protein n=1 Tax=Eucalyptus globulus TaxID=34317 RepID=A0ABD3KGQ1_EUCGL